MNPYLFALMRSFGFRLNFHKFQRIDGQEFEDLPSTRYSIMPSWLHVPSSQQWEEEEEEGKLYIYILATILAVGVRNCISDPVSERQIFKGHSLLAGFLPR
jgi:hypothetical protein